MCRIIPRWGSLRWGAGQPGGTRGTPGTVRGGGVSESVAKAPRAGIGREKKRGISTILFRRSGAIGAFATDLDKPRRHGPRDGRHGSRRRPLDAPLTPRRALRTRKCSSNRRSRVQNAPLESRMHISTSTGPTRSCGRRPTRGACPRPRPPVHDSRREGADIRHSRRADEEGYSGGGLEGI